MKLNAARQRLDGQLVNLAIGGVLKLPLAYSPNRQFFSRRARSWRRSIPGFTLFTKITPSEVIVIRTK